jgi:hypothetical protein
VFSDDFVRHILATFADHRRLPSGTFTCSVKVAARVGIASNEFSNGSPRRGRPLASGDTALSIRKLKS